MKSHIHNTFVMSREELRNQVQSQYRMCIPSNKVFLKPSKVVYRTYYKNIKTTFPQYYKGRGKVFQKCKPLELYKHIDDVF